MSRRREFPDTELQLRVKTIMVLRLVFLTGFVALVLFFQNRFGFSASIVPLSIVIGAGYFFSLLYAVLFRAMKPSHAAMVQAGGDLLLIGGIIYTTGGIHSPLSFLYVFVIIATSITLPRSACFLMASGASLIYGGIIDLEYFQIIHPVYLFGRSTLSFESGYGFYIVILNVASYYAVAYLSGILSDRLQIMKEELALASSDLQELQDFHSHVVQDMGNGLITTNREGRITSANQAAEDITGYSLEECLDRPGDEVLGLPALKVVFEQPDHVDLPGQIEGETRREDGKKIFIRMKVSRFSGHGKPAKGFICVFEDLTQVREMQAKMAQAEQLAVVGRFSAGLAHEIRNPLASLSGSIQVLSKGLQLDRHYKRLMDIVIKETDRLNFILSDFLNYSQPRENRNALVDLTQLIEDVILLLRNSENNDLSIEIVFEREADHLILHCDEQQVKQMVWNLCINAMQAMKTGGRLLLCLHRVASFHNGDYHAPRGGLVLKVVDEGCGIPEEKLDKIFDPFFSTKDNGVGLGLATVRQIIQRSGGNLEVVSEPGRGTCFTVFLPEPDPPPKEPETSGTASAPHPASA